jgi:hypothetical protein
MKTLYFGDVYKIKKGSFYVFTFLPPLPLKEVVWELVDFLNRNPKPVVHHIKGLDKKRRILQITGLYVYCVKSHSSSKFENSL